MGRKLEIAIVAWNQYALTRKCIDSVRAGTRNPYLIRLIDNGSTDDVSKIGNGNDLAVIRNQSNQGWVAACNLAIAAFLEGDADYLVLANNDCEFSNGWDEAWIRHFESDARVGAVGPVSNNITGFQNVAASDGRKWGSSYYLIYMAVCFSRAALEKVGGLDPLFTKGSDDLDHSIRMRDAGYRLIVDRTTFFPHVMHASFTALLGKPPERDYWLEGNQQLIKKHGKEKVMQLFKRKPAVAICTPSITMGPPYWDWTCQFIAMLDPDVTKVKIGFGNVLKMVIDSARNFLCGGVLVNDYDYLFFLDDDTVPPPDTVQKFAEEDRDVLFAMTYQKEVPYHPCAFVYDVERKCYHSTPQLHNGIIEVQSVGMAATMIRTNILHKMKQENPSFFKWREYSEAAQSEVGEDVRFCERVRALGYKIWCDTDRVCIHMGMRPTCSNEKTFLAFMKANFPAAYAETYKDEVIEQKVEV